MTTTFDDQCDREFSETCFVSDDVMLLPPPGAKNNSNKKSKSNLVDASEAIQVRTTSDNVNSVEITSSTPNSESSAGKDSGNDGNKSRPPHPKPRRQDKASQADGRKGGKLSLVVRHSGVSADSGLSSEDSHDRLERRKKAKEAIRRKQAEEKVLYSLHNGSSYLVMLINQIDNNMSK